jgi:hypothetical protein
MVASDSAQQRDGKNPSWFVRHFIARPSLGLAALLTIATIVQVFVSVHQGQSMAEQNEIMVNQIRQTDETLSLMRFAERPWVLAETPLLAEVPPESFETNTLTYTQGNVGNSPAVIMATEAHIFLEKRQADLTKYEKMAQDKALRLRGREMTLPAGSKYQRHLTVKRDMNENTRRLYDQKEVELFCVIACRYRDFFGEEYDAINVFIYNRDLNEFSLFGSNTVTRKQPQHIEGESSQAPSSGNK